MHVYAWHLEIGRARAIVIGQIQLDHNDGRMTYQFLRFLSVTYKTPNCFNVLYPKSEMMTHSQSE